MLLIQNIKNHSGDLNNPDELQEVTGDIYLIIHFTAAKSEVGVSDEEYHTHNVYATEALMRFTGDRGMKRDIYYSTVSAYGHKNGPQDESVVFESDTIYDVTKLEGKFIINKWLGLER